MNKVKNKKVICRIADKARIAGKSRNRIAVIAIALTTILFTTVFTVGTSLVEKQQQQTMRQVGGTTHAGYKYLTQKEYDIVKKDKEIKEISYRILVGDVIDDALKKLTIEVSYYEDLDAKFSFCYPEVGRMPIKEDEIVTSDLVLEALDIPAKIGAKVPITLDIKGKSVTKTFTLSGYFKGDIIAKSQVICVSKEYAKKVAPTPTKSAMGHFIDTTDYVGRIMADFNFSSSFNLEEKVKKLTERCGFPEDAPVGINWAYIGNNVDSETIVIIAVLLVIILTSSYLIIYNIFYINIFHDIQYYGLLKTIGTTGKQLRKIVRRQAYMLSLYGIPLGLILGALIGKVILPMVMKTLIFSDSTNTDTSLNPWIFIGASIFTLASVYLSCIKPCLIASGVSPIEAVRYTEGQEDNKSFWKKNRRKEKKTRKVTPITMAYTNVNRNKKKFIIVVASLSMGLVLLNCVYSIIIGFDMDKFVKPMIASDFSVEDATLDKAGLPLNKRVLDGVTKKFLHNLKRKKGVTEIGNIYVTQKDMLDLDKREYKKFEKRIFQNKEILESIKSMSKEEAEYFKELEKNMIIDGNIYGLGKLAFENIEVTEGKLDWKKFLSGKYVITGQYSILDDKTVNYYNVGETVTIKNDNGETRKYEVMAVGDLVYACGLQVFGMFNCNYILPEKEYLDFIGKQQPMRTIFNVDKQQMDTIEEWITKYCTNIEPDLTYKSKRTISSEFETSTKMYAMIGSLLGLTLGIIGILNFINTIVTSVLSRKQEFAMMEAVGLTKRQLKTLLCYEGAFYIIVTIIASVIISSLLNLTVIRFIGNQLFFFTGHFTLLPIILCIPILLALSIIVAILCCNNMRKQSTVERMRKIE